TYEVRVFAAGMQGMRLQGVLVKANQVSRADAALASSGQPGLVVEVVAPAQKASEEAQILQRKAAPSVSETISAETMKKTAGSDVATVIRRAPGITVRDDRFVFVRGLGERYTQALLDGSKLPSTDPQKRVVPLDLFPAGFLDSLNIIKTFTPNLPGDFSGGLIDLNLREFPDKFLATLTSSFGVTPQASFRDFQTYRSTNLDYVGMGAGFRGLPAGMPADVDEAFLGKRRVFSIARQFRDIWDVDEVTAPPNTGLGFTLGNSIGPFGFQVGGLYANEYKRYRDVVDRQFQGTTDSTTPVETTNFRRSYSIFQNKWGAIATGSYKVNDNNKLFLRSLIENNAYDNVQTGIGTIVSSGSGFIQQQSVLRYTVEQLNFGQLAGELAEVELL